MKRGGREGKKVRSGAFHYFRVQGGGGVGHELVLRLDDDSQLVGVDETDLLGKRGGRREGGREGG